MSTTWILANSNWLRRHKVLYSRLRMSKGCWFQDPTPTPIPKSTDAQVLQLVVPHPQIQPTMDFYACVWFLDADTEEWPYILMVVNVTSERAGVQTLRPQESSSERERVRVTLELWLWVCPDSQKEVIHTGPCLNLYQSQTICYKALNCHTPYAKLS